LRPDNLIDIIEHIVIDVRRSVLIRPDAAPAARFGPMMAGPIRCGDFECMLTPRTVVTLPTGSRRLAADLASGSSVPQRLARSDLATFIG